MRLDKFSSMSENYSCLIHTILKKRTDIIAINAVPETEKRAKLN